MLNKKTKFMMVAVLASMSMAFTPVAQAGKIKKLLGIGAVATVGIIGYKVYQKMKISEDTYNFANNIGSLPELDNHQEMIPKIMSDIKKIQKDPSISVAEKEKFTVLEKEINNRYGTSTGTTTNVVSDGVNVDKSPVANNVYVNANDNEKLLEANLLSAGYVKPNGYRAFHIVSITSSATSAARSILGDVGIDLNSSKNGIFLPYSVNGLEVNYKNVIDNKSYNNMVNDKIMNAFNDGNAQSVNITLENLRANLKNGYIQ